MPMWPTASRRLQCPSPGKGGKEPQSGPERGPALPPSCARCSPRATRPWGRSSRASRRGVRVTVPGTGT
jgi:hypothetical protein